LALIEFRDVTFTHLHKKNPALNDINLAIDEKEFIALLGPLGAGKSTLLYSLNGVVPHLLPGHLKGDILVDGKNTKDHDVAELVTSVGLVIDDPTVQVFNLTVIDDVEFGPLNVGVALEEIPARSEYSLSASRLKGLETRHPKELSGGQQQALSLAGVLAMRPKVLGLDEPISMLDPIGKNMMLQAVRDINEKFEATCIIAESGADLEDVMNLVDRVIVMDEGRILAQGDPRVAVKDGLLEKVGVGMPQVSLLFRELKKKVPGIEIPARFDDAIALLSGYLDKGVIKVRKHRAVKGPSTDVAKAKPYVNVENLTFIYPGGVKALDNVNFQLRQGEFTGIIGQNGSGKSTLAQCIVGVYKPSNPDAEIRVDDVDVVRSSIKEIVTKVNYVFQNPDCMLFSKDVNEEVGFGLRMLEYPKEKINDIVDETLRLLGLQEHKGTLINDLPRYLRTLVGLASVLVLRPNILIIDEPTNGLDRRESLRLLNYLRELQGKGLTFAIITHDMKLVSEFCDRVVVMNEGRILLDGKPAEVFSSQNQLRQASLKPPQIAQLAQAVESYGLSAATLSVDDFMDQLEAGGR
jgi:energy-coupling factor transporter ATP-binding protein EcfA2